MRRRSIQGAAFRIAARLKSSYHFTCTDDVQRLPVMGKSAPWLRGVQASCSDRCLRDRSESAAPVRAEPLMRSGRPASRLRVRGSPFPDLRGHSQHPYPQPRHVAGNPVHQRRPRIRLITSACSMFDARNSAHSSTNFWTAAWHQRGSVESRIRIAFLQAARNGATPRLATPPRRAAPYRLLQRSPQVPESPAPAASQCQGRGQRSRRSI